jgi:tripartite-type tricarboxylate transporter receptor subunit TctC
MKRVIVAAVTAIAVMAVAASAMGTAAFAQDFYKGKQIRLIVSSAAGGGYDSVGRLLQRYMPQYIPGHPNMIVMNMPGAGGLIAANHIANAAEKDGTVIALLNRYVTVLPILGAEQAKFKSQELQWIGTTASYSDNAYLLVIRSALPHKTIADLRNPDMPINIGVTGTDVPAILKEALGLNFKLISGYKGSDDMELAFERGEVDGHTSGYNSVLSRHPDWIEKGFIRTMLQFGRVDRLPALKDVPTARELATTPADRALIEFAEMPLLIARPIAAPPGIPPDRLRILREAFAKTMADPQHTAESNKQKLELSPKSGEEVQAIIASLAKIDRAVVQRYIKALGGKRPSGG